MIKEINSNFEILHYFNNRERKKKLEPYVNNIKKCIPFFTFKG